MVFKFKNSDRSHLVIPISKQIKAWQRANRKMSWGITKEHFDRVKAPPVLTESDRNQGFIGVGLFYGFGDDGFGNSDPVLSGKLAWKYACKSWWLETWQCEYIDFNKPDHVRVRPGAPARPKNFYYAKFQPGWKFQSLTVSQVRKSSDNDTTGCGAEGIQFLVITHPHFQRMMNKRKIPFMAFADYDVAPYGHNDFFDAVQMFQSNDVLGLGIGNVDFKYRLFGIPTIRIYPSQMI
jgi:hypothetical protein